MELTHHDCESALSVLSDGEQARFLALFGHELTILARTAYEFQAPGVIDPRLLRDLNEIHHRIYNQLSSLARDAKPSYSPDILASLLLAEHRTHLRPALSQAFGRALERFGAAA